MKDFPSFKDMKKIAKSLKLKSQKEWNCFTQNNKHLIYPSNPQLYYKKEWKGWGDFLGTGNVKSKNFISFEEAKKLVHSFKLKNECEYKDYVRKNKINSIPLNPELKYKKQGWISWGDFLGTNFVATYKRKFLPFEEAREFVRSLNLKNSKDWKNYLKSGLKPSNIPASPNSVYKNNWLGMQNWIICTRS